VDSGALDASRSEQARALDGVDIRLMAEPGVTIDKEGKKSVSHFLLQYDVAKNFNSYTLRFASERVRELYMARVQELDFKAAVQQLYNGMAASTKKDVVPGAMENAVFYMLQKAVPWQRFHGAITQETLKPSPNMHRAIVKKLPKFADMDVNTLYVLKDQNFPAIEAVFKDINGNVYGVQVKSGERKDKQIMARKLLEIHEKLGLASGHMLNVLYITLPDEFDDWCKVKTDFSPGTPTQCEKMSSTEIKQKTADMESKFALKITVTFLTHSFNPFDIFGVEPQK
jgi:hypothetical protein